MEQELKVKKIQNGTVIDHIKAGLGLEVLKILGIDSKFNGTVSYLMNTQSKKLGRKDVVKLENKELKPDDVNKIALISPNATINIIRDYEVVEKRNVELPSVINGIIKCSNPNCITNAEKIITKFYVVKKEPLELKCHYCERVQ